jgi:hypothetical protein
MARGLIEHGQVVHVEASGDRGTRVKWQGERIPVGQGRRVDETQWKRVRAQMAQRRGEETYAKTAAGYVEVDFVTGRRVVVRKPESMDVVFPKGREIPGWTWF